MDADHPYLLATSARARRAVDRRAAGALGARRLGAVQYLPGITGSGVIASPDEVIARWTLELEALVAEGGLFMLTNHPFVSRAGVPRGRAWSG